MSSRAGDRLNTNKLKQLVCLLLLSLLMFPVSSLADETQEEKITVQNLYYDAENAVLQGKTIPNANISIENVVGEVLADEKGQFAIPVDSQAKTIKLMIFDYMTNRSVSLVYDLINQKIVEPSEENNSLSPKDSKTTTSDSDLPKKERKDENKSVIPQLLLVIVIILGSGSLIVLAYNHKQRKS